MKRNIAIDSGSSFIKILSDANRGKYHAVTRRIEYDSDDALNIDGARYVVGAPALKTYIDDYVPINPYVHGGFHGSVEQHAQICYALQRLGAGGDYDTLVLSLPYTESRDASLRDVLRSRRDYTWGDSAGKSHAVHFDTVEVMPQGVGALVVLEAEHSARPGTLFLVDIGSCTIDEVAVRYSAERQRYVYLHERSKSRRTLSAMAFFQHWHDELRESDGLQLLQKGYYDLMDMAVGGQFEMRFGSRSVDTRPSFDASVRWFTQMLYNLLQSDMGPVLAAEADSIVLTGGGSELVDLNVLQRTDSRIVRLPVWANVEGQWMQASGQTKDTSLHAAVQGIREVINEKSS